MLTKSDLAKIAKLISNAFDDPQNSIRRDLDALRKELRAEIRSTSETVKKELKHDIVTFKQEILGEIQGLRDEVAIVTGYKDQIENHEDCIVSLEKRLPH